MLLLALRNLRAKVARNVLTFLSVLIAMGLLTFVVAAQTQLSGVHSYLTGRNNMIVMARADEFQISSLKKVLAQPGVKRAMYMFVLGGKDPSGKGVTAHATTWDYMTISDQWFFVDPEARPRWEADRTGALVGRKTAADLGLKEGSPLTLETPFGPLPIRVTAISSRGFKSQGIIIHHQYFAELFGKHERASHFWVEMDPTADVKASAAQMDALFANTDTPAKTVSASANLKDSIKRLRVVPNLLLGATIILLAATFLVTASTISITVRERKTELSTLRAIGFRRGKIVQLIVSEVASLCLAGGVVGGAIVIALAQGGLKLGEGVLELVDMRPAFLGWVALASVALGVFCSLIPALRASRIPVAQGLRARN